MQVNVVCSPIIWAFSA